MKVFILNLREVIVCIHGYRNSLVEMKSWWRTQGIVQVMSLIKRPGASNDYSNWITVALLSFLSLSKTTTAYVIINQFN